MKKWIKFNLFKTIFYIVIMCVFSAVIFLNLSIKIPKDENNNTKKKIMAANILSLIAFCLLLIHHYINTLWKEGFIIIVFMVLLSMYSTYKVMRSSLESGIQK